MTFRDNLLKKLKISQLEQTIRKTIAPDASSVRLDTAAMRTLLGLSRFTVHRERDLEMYIKDPDAPLPLILVLDNELPIYRSTIADVAIRKSPTTKEMVNIRNIIKILKDSDVKISRKEGSLDTVLEDCLSTLDLNYTADDIQEIAAEGKAALELGKTEEVTTVLKMLTELTDFRPAPTALKHPDHLICGRLIPAGGDGHWFGPFWFYGAGKNQLGMVTRRISTTDLTAMTTLQEQLGGEVPPPVHGGEVFDHLQSLILSGS